MTEIDFTGGLLPHRGMRIGCDRLARGSPTIWPQLEVPGEWFH